MAEPIPATLTLRYSNDGGTTWSDPRTAPIGNPPSSRRVVFWRLGAGRNRVWEISTTDPVPFIITGAVMEGEVGNA